MCGIFFYLSYNDDEHRIDQETCNNNFNKTEHRGPDKSVMKYSSDSEEYQYYMGFHRLSINDLTENGNQPFHSRGIYCMCNGEIYNFRQLAEKYKVSLNSGSDCEIILRLYIRSNHRDEDFMSYVQELHGVFAFTIFDTWKEEIIVGRDPIGVRSLYIGTDEAKWQHMCISSEMKSIHSPTVEQFPPGCIMTYDISSRQMLSLQKYTPILTPQLQFAQTSITQQMYNISHSLESAVKLRMISDRPIACLLSGGLDSSLISALVAKQLTDPRQLHTFSVGMEGSTDLHYADIVAKHIGSTHHNILVTQEELLQELDNTIYQIESYDVTTIRASVPMFCLCKKIKQMKDLDIAVLFSGEGSDELCGSYMYFHKAPSQTDFNSECYRLLHELRYFDVLRCDKCISGAGLEARVPFLDKDFVTEYLRSDPETRMPTNGIEKFLLRNAFDKCYPDLLPKSVLWRTKEAFSDGVSSVEKSWYSILQDSLESQNPELSPLENERKFYKDKYNSFYSHNNHTPIPHYWLPKWCGNIQEPSARILDDYAVSTTD